MSNNEIMQSLAALSKKKTQKYYFGMDLGTTNSSIAVFDSAAFAGLEPPMQLVNIAQQTERGQFLSPLLPSILFCKGDGKVLCGEGAKEFRKRPVVRGKNIFYSVKSEMGLGREPFYKKALNCSFDAPYKVSGRYLSELKTGAEDNYGVSIADRSVVTVPASFQSSQRKDTLRSAQLAGLNIDEAGLLDEPNAALLCYLFSEESQELDFKKPLKILVFDFGGGTCDISILELILHTGRSCPLQIRNLSISRYDQLGGDNIDNTIAYEILFPRWLEENGLKESDFNFVQKRDSIMPQLTFHAEVLKLGLCNELSLKEELHGWERINLEDMESAQPPEEIIVDKKNRHFLEEVKLTGSQFEQVMQAFIEVDNAMSVKGEYHSKSSVFAPIQDALEKASLEPEDIDAVLPIGGSSNNPLIIKELKNYFDNSKFLYFKDKYENLLCVSRGAAIHAYFLHGHGISIVPPITSEPIGVLTRGEVFEPVISTGVEVPFPGGSKWKQLSEFEVPKANMHNIDIVLCSESAEKVITKASLKLPARVPKGSPIDMSIRIDGHKVLHAKAALRNFPASAVEIRYENPLSPSALSRNQRKIKELEEEIAEASDNNALGEVHWEMSELAWLCRKEDHFEKGLQWCRLAIKHSQEEHAAYENILATIYEDLGQHGKAEHHYKRAIELKDTDPSIPYNLGLFFLERGKEADAVKMFERAIENEPDYGPALIYLADCLEEDGSYDKAKEYLTRARQWILDNKDDELEKTIWLLAAARRMGDKKQVRELEKRARRLKWSPACDIDTDSLPMTIKDKGEK